MNQRTLILLASLLGIFSLLFAFFFMQEFLGLEPCPLCILDRYAIGFFSVFGLLCWLLYPRIKQVFFAGMFLAIIAGLATGIRHVYIEWFPYDSSSCFPAPNENSFLDFFVNAFAGRSDCALIDWTLLGVSLAEMTLILMAFLFIFMIYIIFIKKQQTKNNQEK